MIADLVRRLLGRPKRKPDPAYGQMIDQLQTERTQSHAQAIRKNRQLRAGLESLRGEAGLYLNGTND